MEETNIVKNVLEWLKAGSLHSYPSNPKKRRELRLSLKRYIISGMEVKYPGIGQGKSKMDMSDDDLALVALVNILDDEND